MADGLPRHPEQNAKFFLPNALPRDKSAVGNRLDQSLVDLIY